MRQILLTGIAITLLISQVGAVTDNRNFERPVTKNLTIEADKVTYLENNQFVDATGNVIVVYQNYRITANHSVLDTERDQVFLTNGFVMQRSKRLFVGNELDYNLQTDTGRATQVKFDFSGNYIRGKEVIIGKDTILVEKATMTVCDLDPPHYHIEAEKITIYTRWNLTVADNAVMYIGSVPVAYIPSYVINNLSNDVSQALIPEFGSNAVEGDYVKVKWGYHFNEKFQGTLDMDYLSKLEYRAGFTNTSLLSNHSSLQTRVHQVGRKGVEFGLRYRTLLGVSNKDANQGSVADFFAGILPPSRSQYPELTVDLTHREFINLQTISLAPEVTLQAPSYFIWNSSWYLTGLASVGHITEENTGTFEKFRIVPTVGTSWSNVPFFETVHENVNFDSSTYYLDGKPVNTWQRYFNNLGFQRQFFGFLNSFTNYRYTFLQGGGSPFNYDQFNQAEPYELSQEAWFYIGRNRFGTSVSYGFQSQTYRTVNYFIDIGLHEWVIKLAWQTKIGDFRLGFGITNDF